MKKEKIEKALTLVTLVATIAAVGFAVSPRLHLPKAAVATWKPEGLDTTAMLIVTSSCSACKSGPLMEAVRKGTRIQFKQPSHFRFVGVSADWGHDDGLSTLKRMGQFTEINVGNGWANGNLLRYIWEDSTALPIVPQLILIERRFTRDDSRMNVTQDRVINRVIGASSLQRWFDKRYPDQIASNTK